MIITKKHNTAHPPLYMNNTQIKHVTQHTHLGVIIEELWSWKNHIETILGKAWKRIDILRSLKFKLDRQTLETMYFSYIRPLLEYSDIVWGNCSQSDTQALEKLQTEAGRVVTGATRSASASRIHTDTGWETLEYRRQKHRMLTMHKI